MLKRYKTRITPFISDELRELALEASHIFFREIHTLDSNGEQIDGENRFGIVLPTGGNPEQIRDNQAYAKKSNGTTHPPALCSQHDQHEDSTDDAITR